ncbi:hypothetical protein F4Y93_04685 [Candidatus Poribacteria bacterium]|nr:hypothetical protein [Candidatus Poribacteria bacterium]
MKNTARLLNATLTIYVLLTSVGGANAAFWEDPFERESEENWQHKGADSVWTVEDGFLKAEIQAQGEWRSIFKRYQFIAFPGPYNDFTITLENVGVSRARFGIALAKHFESILPGIEDEYGYYLFFTNDMQPSRDGNLFVDPGQRWSTPELQEMVLSFKDGRFQLSADGESRIDFTDANFDQIDNIAFVLAAYVTEDVNVGNAWVENFTIDGLAVSPKRKLSTTWAHLKTDNQ